MPKITYGGPRARTDNSTAFQVRDADGKRHLLRKGIETDVPDDVAKLLLGDDAPTGHKFEAAPTPEKPPAEDAPATTTTTASRRGRAGSES